MRVLVVEDERVLADAIATGLRREALAVDVAYDGAGALDRAGVNEYDVIVLDRDLPRVHGDDVCKQLVAQRYPARIIMLTAAGELDDRVEGLSIGADDYLAKPFGLAELLARVRALLRRTATMAPPLEEGALRIDVAAHRVYVGEDQVSLTGKEFDVLSVLVAQRDRVVSRDRLMTEVWDANWYGSTKTLDVTIGRLRNKLDAAGVTDKVVAVRGVGFRLEAGNRDA